MLRVEELSREDVLGGQSFGAAGPYERIAARVRYGVDPANAHNRRIVDLDKVADLHQGQVEFSADLVVLRPKDPRKANGTLILEVPNRGRPRLLGLLDGGDWNAAVSAGDAWALRNGYTYAAVGWQCDAVGDGALRLEAPVATDHGKPIEGLVRGDYMPSRALEDVPLGHMIVEALGGSEYPVAAPQDPRNALTVRPAPASPREPIAPQRWSFTHRADGRLEASDRYLHLEGGFQPGMLYEYVYVANNPVVAGLGFAAVRDFASYAKHAPGAVARARRVIGAGISQNGRFLRDMLYQGFNADEDGRIALDGVIAHVAGAGRGSFNQRFAQPSRDAQPTSAVFFPTDVFPFTDLPETDPLTNERGALLERARQEKVVPKIFFSNTSYEYWGRAAALTTTTADGRRDAALAPEVRVYAYTGLQHFSGPWPPAKGTGSLMGQQPQSPLPVKFFWRSMIAHMDAWVRGVRPAPPSRYPRIADGTLVAFEAYRFPKIPGIAVPADASRAWRLDFGPDWRKGIQSIQPPVVGQPFPVLVPQVDADGNELGGIRLPAVAVPLATYTPWNLRDPAIGAPEQRVSFEGSYLPFAKSAEVRQQSGDPRASITERYASKADYLARYARAADDLIREGYILAEDRVTVLQRGAQEWDYATR